MNVITLYEINAKISKVGESMEYKIVPLTVSDFSNIVEWVNNYDKDFIFQWAGSTYKFPLTLEQMKEHYAKGFNSNDSETFIYKVVDRYSQEMIGTVQLGKIDRIIREAILGRFLLKSEDHRGQGLGTKVLREIVRIGFEEFSLDRIRLYVFHLNTQAIRCYKKVGFSVNSITEDVYQSIRGDNWNRIEMILDKENWCKLEEGIDIR